MEAVNTMWQIENRTPFTSEGYLARSKEGKQFWCVAVRARFKVNPNQTVSIADQQTPVKTSQEYLDEASKELKCEQDFSPFKSHTDILCFGEAYSLGLENVNSIKINLEVGKIQKCLAVYGKRILTKQNNSQKYTLESEPLSSLALSWKYSYGGVDLALPGEEVFYSRNPIGMGFSSKPYTDLCSAHQIELPHFEYPNAPVSNNNENLIPAGFTALQRFWEPRRFFAGTYDDHWKNNRAPRLPSDFSDEFYQTAPQDQIYPGNLVGYEPVRVHGMHSDGEIAFSVPRIFLKARTFIAGKIQESDFKIISLELYPNERAFEMVWNSHVNCNAREHLVEKTTVWMKKIVRMT